MTKAATPTAGSEKPRSIFDLFETDPNLEKTGITIDYGDFGYFRLARAGGANEKYEQVLQQKAAPLRRALENGILPPATLRKLQRETLVETLLLGWGSPTYGEGSLVGKGGDPLPFTAQNALELFSTPGMQDLPNDLLEQARSSAGFKAAIGEGEAKN